MFLSLQNKTDDYKEKKRSTSSKQRKQNKLDVASKRDMRSTFRRSSVGLCRIERARIRTLKMTIVIGKFNSLYKNDLRNYFKTCHHNFPVIPV